MSQIHYSLSRSYIKSFLQNSYNQLKQITKQSLFLKPFDPLQKHKKLLNMVNNRDAFGIGCDQDIGGYSQCLLEMDHEQKLKFYGNLSLALSPDSDAIYTGYAALRTRKPLPRHFMDSGCWDASGYPYMILVAKGDHRSYSFNFKTTKSFAGDLYTCQFKFSNPYQWEHVILPLENFIRMNCGAEYLRQYPPNMENIESFGILLADNLPGPFQVTVDSLWFTTDPADFCSTFKLEGSQQIEKSSDIDIKKNLISKEKVRKDFQESLQNFYGLGGMDLGDHAIETKKTQYLNAKKRQTDLFRSNLVDHPHFELEIERKVIRKKN